MGRVCFCFLFGSKLKFVMSIEILIRSVNAKIYKEGTFEMKKLE